MKPIIKVLMTLLVLVLILCSCSPGKTEKPALTSVPTAQIPTPVSEAIELTDGLGRVVKMAGPARRIISLSPSNSEIIFALGAGSALVARDDFTNFPEEASTLPSIGGAGSEFNLESITGLNPDLILAAEIIPIEQIKALEDLKINVFMLSNPVDFDGLYANLTAAGALTGKNDVALSLISDIKARLAVIEDKVAGAENQPTVFYELDGTDPSKPWTTGPGTFINLLLEKAGGKNIASDLEGAWVQISQEELIIRNPDIILLGDSIYGVTAEQVATRPGWENMSAVRKKRVVPINDDLVSRPGPRLIEGLETVAQALHPELFQ